MEVFGVTRYSRGRLVAATTLCVVDCLTHARHCMTSSRSAIREGFTIGVSTRNNTNEAIGSYGGCETLMGLRDFKQLCNICEILIPHIAVEVHDLLDAETNAGAIALSGIQVVNAARIDLPFAHWCSNA